MYRELLVLVLMLSAIGCGAKGPKLVNVEGTVTRGSEPVAGALLSFQPDDPAASPSYGETDASGRYKLEFSPQRSGAMVGMHTVTITTENENLRQSETMPAEYREGNGVKREVKDENNIIDFAIESK